MARHLAFTDRSRADRLVDRFLGSRTRPSAMTRESSPVEALPAGDHETDRLSRRASADDLGRRAASALPCARARAQTLDKVSYQTNWRAQAEHGGFYLAVANGIYKKHGIECDIRRAGRSRTRRSCCSAGAST